MSVSRMPLLALVVAAAGGLAAAGWLSAAEPPVATTKPGEAVPVQSSDQGKPADKADKGAKGGEDSVRVTAPGTKVNVDKDSGKVSVTAPFTDVRVDPDKGRVRVRAPYVNLDISW
jgi:CO/xanthine dehydrogenase Mo-binding subunit